MVISSNVDNLKNAIYRLLITQVIYLLSLNIKDSNSGIITALQFITIFKNGHSNAE